MKKLKLNLQQFEGAEVLTRSQLKKVLGGGEGGSSITCNCNSKDDCKDSKSPTCYNGEAYKCTNTDGKTFAGVCDG